MRNTRIRDIKGTNRKKLYIVSECVKLNALNVNGKWRSLENMKRVIEDFKTGRRTFIPIITNPKRRGIAVDPEEVIGLVHKMSIRKGYLVVEGVLSGRGYDLVNDLQSSLGSMNEEVNLTLSGRSVTKYCKDSKITLNDNFDGDVDTFVAFTLRPNDNTRNILPLYTPKEVEDIEEFEKLSHCKLKDFKQFDRWVAKSEIKESSDLDGSYCTPEDELEDVVVDHDVIDKWNDASDEELITDLEGSIMGSGVEFSDLESELKTMSDEEKVELLKNFNDREASSIRDRQDSCRNLFEIHDKFDDKIEVKKCDSETSQQSMSLTIDHPEYIPTIKGNK